jgi:hypothetical protein
MIGVRLHCIVLSFLLAPAQRAVESSRVTLTEPLAEWKREIESIRGSQVVFARIFLDRERNEMRLPEDTASADVLRRYLRVEAFRSQLAAAHSLTVNHSGSGGAIHFIVVNMGFADEWSGAEDELLAHELGHAWLDEKGFRSPPFGSGEPCIAVHTGGIVQHILIRAETARRGISLRRYWIGNLETSLRFLSSPDAGRTALSPCQRLIQLAQLVDTRLGLTALDWPALNRFEELHRKLHPEIAVHADAIASYLRGRDVSGQIAYDDAIRFVGREVTRAFRGRTGRSAGTE